MRNMTVALIACSAALPPMAAAQTPSAITDLVGSRAAGGEAQLQSRGYVHIKTDEGDDRSWSYWWQPTRRECVSVAVTEGRFDAITTTPAPDCNQPTQKNNGGAAAAAAGIAIIGAIALAHSSHHHDDGEHLDDQGDDQYERGFRDGLYNQSYHNYDRQDAYSDGYSKGVGQRERETRYRDGQADGVAGYAPSVNVSDLVGTAAAGADSELERRGFRVTKAYQIDKIAYTFRGNARTNQCVQVAVIDGRIRYILPIPAKSCGN